MQCMGANSTKLMTQERLKTHAPPSLMHQHASQSEPSEPFGALHGVQVLVLLINILLDKVS